MASVMVALVDSRGLLWLVLSGLTLEFRAELGVPGGTAEIHGDDTGCNQGHSNKLPMGGHLAVKQQADQHDRHDADSTPEGIGEAHRQHLHHP